MPARSVRLFEGRAAVAIGGNRPRPSRGHCREPARRGLLAQLLDDSPRIFPALEWTAEHGVFVVSTLEPSH
jgi:hypothetical protein